jgi:AcrR family transcriptional regulator
MEETIKTDRRVRRTTAAIQSAFLKLIFEKDINQITVRELCELADINKSTFYLHYRDIYDLAEQFKHSLATQICDIVLEYEITDFIPKAAEIWERVLGLYLDDPATPLSFHDTALNFMAEAINTQVLETVLARLSASVSGEDEAQIYRYRIFTTFIITGFLGLLRSFDTEELLQKKGLEIISQGLESGLKLTI